MLQPGFRRDLVTLWEDAGVGTHNETIFTTSKSSPPLLESGASLSVIDTGGTSPERTHTTRVAGGAVVAVTRPAYERPSAIVITRAKKPDDAFAMARAAYDACAGFRNGFINSGWYREINVGSEPTDLSMDVRGDARYSFNVTAIKRPS